MTSSRITNKKTQKLYFLYRKLHAAFGPQHWWPADSAFEVAVGAILTQNTNWGNVEKAIQNLKDNNVLGFTSLLRISDQKLASLIRPAGYFNLKAKRLKSFVRFLSRSCHGDIKKLALRDARQLRQALLGVNGIGPETADSILLYALRKPLFVVDAYTKRIFTRHGFLREEAEYGHVQNLFMQNLKNEVQLFNEYHALLVKLGKDFCLKNKPKCDVCPLHALRRRSNA